ncbi:MAG: hypothetical protein JRJ02_00335 [Deltaproteobacteria bacterium]|nr:hypothetical protein [Deltaproteobacteria bacterium]MBW1860807.1 hypothetical protein [Deltaproteobacteria bacterium]
MLKIDYTLFIQIANFLFLLFLLNILLYRPIRKILSRRAEEINSFQDATGDFQNKSAQYAIELEANMVDARKGGYREKENLKNAGLAKEKGLLQEAITSTEGKIGKAKEEILHKAAEARQSLENEVELFSQELVEKILGKSN